MNIADKTPTGIVLTAGLLIVASMFTVNALGLYAFAQGIGGRQQDPPPEAYTACDGKSAGDTAEFVSPYGDTVTGTCVQEEDRIVLRPHTPPSRRAMNDDGATRYAMVDKHQIAFYNSNGELAIRLKERDPDADAGQADDPQALDTDTRVGPVDADIAGPIWRLVSGNCRYRLADANAYPGLLTSDSCNDLRLYSLTESFSDGEFEPNARYLDLTRYTLYTFGETERQYWNSNFDEVGIDHDGIGAEYHVKLFSIDTEGNITGIIPAMHH